MSGPDLDHRVRTRVCAGEFQLVNAGLAVTTLQTLQRRWSNAPVKTSSEPPRPASEQRGLEVQIRTVALRRVRY
eukprot:876484-Rhodomonas_salina.1